MEANNLFGDIQPNTAEPEEQRWVAATCQAAHDWNISHDRPSQAARSYKSFITNKITLS